MLLSYGVNKINMCWGIFKLLMKMLLSSVLLSIKMRKNRSDYLWYKVELDKH